jgi:hypothetical protein
MNLKQLCDALGLDKLLGPLDSDINQCFDDEEGGRTCSAELRMNADANELEADVQLFYDDPDDDEIPPFQQIMLMQARPKKDGGWEIISVFVKDENMTGKFSGWAESAMALYTAITHSLKQDEIPDIDALIDEHMDGEDGRPGRAGRRGGGRKNPKFKPPSNTYGMKTGM